MTSTALDYLRQLVEPTGVSGAEQDVVRLVTRLARPLADTVEIDPMGNVLAVRHGSGPDDRRVLLAAHMDEIGFRIRAVEDNGFLRFEKVGGSDNRVLLAQRVWVGTSVGRMLGVIGVKSAHLATEEDRAAAPDHSLQYIDIGARDADQARSMGVRLGAPAGFVGELAELGARSGRYTAHALDDRVGCAVLLAVLEELRRQPQPVEVIAAFTVQEEVGLRGAQAAARRFPFDVGLAIDSTALDDTPDTNAAHPHLRLGAGAAVKIMDNSLLAHPAVQRELLAAADRAGLTIQQEILMRIGTDAGALQFGGAGIPAGTVSIGTRYTHSPIEVLDERDLGDAVRLLIAFLSAVPEMDLRFAVVDE